MTTGQNCCMFAVLLQIKKHKLSYFKSFWNILDILVIIIAILCVAFDIYRLVAVDKKLNELIGQPDQYADFDFLSYWQVRFDNAIAIAVFFAWIKVLIIFIDLLKTIPIVLGLHIKSEISKMQTFKISEHCTSPFSKICTYLNIKTYESLYILLWSFSLMTWIGILDKEYGSEYIYSVCGHYNAAASVKFLI